MLQRHSTPWQDVHPERGGGRRQRPPLRFDWSRIAAPPTMRTTWAYRTTPPGSPYELYVYRQGGWSWRWAVIRKDADTPPVRTETTDSKGRAQVAAEQWHVEHVRDGMPTLWETSDREQRTDSGDGGDELPF